MKPRPHRFFALALLLLFCASPAAARLSDDEIVKDLRAHLEQLEREDRFSGAVQLTKNGKVLFEGAYGPADRTFNVPNTPDTIFRFNSMGKMFTAVSILKLAQEGKLSLDAKLIDVLPDYPNKDVASRITIFQLLTHTSGMGDFFGPEYDKASKEHIDTHQDILPFYVDRPLRFEPGAGWFYSNAGFITLGLVIEKVTGQAYQDYVDEHVFKPAGMTHTGNWPADDVIPNRAQGYTREASGKLRATFFDYQRGGAAGGGYSTLDDLQRFAKAVQDGRLLDKKHTDMLMTGVIANGRGGKMTHGLMESVANGVRTVGHGGGGGGFNSIVEMYPEAGYTTTIMANFANAVGLVNNKLRMQLTGEELPTAAPMSAAAMKGYAGKYQPSGGGEGVPSSIEVSADDKGLWVELGQPAKRRFAPLSGDEFFDVDSPAGRLVFTRNDKGEVVGLALSRVTPTRISGAKTTS